MSDPFSISAGVIGVVSLGITVCQGFISYYGPWKSYDEDIQDFTASLDGLLDNLRLLEEFVSDQHQPQLASARHKQIVLTHLATCKKAYRRLEEVLEKCKSSKSPLHVRKNDWARVKRATYPFKKETLATAFQTVTGLQVNLGSILHLLNGALIAQQQRLLEDLVSQTSSVDTRTSRILDLVGQGNTSVQTAISQCSRMNPIPAPSMIQQLCNQRQKINTCWSRLRKKPNSTIELITMYCTCCQKPRYSSQGLSFSTFVLHDKSCPLHLESQSLLGIAAKYTFCTNFLGLSIYLMFTLTRGAGGFTICPTIQLRAVVSDDSPQFKLLSDMIINFRRAEIVDQHKVLQETMDSVLMMFHTKEASPTDQLGDGSTLLHKLAETFGILDALTLDIASMTMLRKFIRVLIKAGVPINEPTSNGHMPLYYFISQFSLCISTRSTGIWEASLGMMRELLGAGTLSQLLQSMRHSKLEERRGPDAEYIYFLRHRSLQTIAQLMLRYADEEPEISDTDLSILTRSENGLRRCLARGSCKSSPSSSPITHINFDISMCLGWPRGISLILESRLQQLKGSLGHHFIRACDMRELESAMVLLKRLDAIDPEHLKAALLTKNSHIVQAVVSEIAMRRRNLLHFAHDRLPSVSIIRLNLPEDSLLDRQAFKVYECLKAHNIKVDPRLSPFKPSVYEIIGTNVNAADMFYKAGFTDLNQCVEDGPLLPTALERYIPLGAVSFIGLIRLSQWMTAHGASLYDPSRWGCPAIHLLTDNLGRALSGSNFTDDKDGSERQNAYSGISKGQSLQSLDVDGAKFLSALLTDSTHDDCSCACSDGGCVPLTRILRSCYMSHQGMATISIPDVFGALYSAIAPYTTEYDLEVFVTRIIRCLTFAELGITHTCLSCYPWKKTNLPQDVDDIREEESILLDQLEALMAEFNHKFGELQLGLEVFLKGYWRVKMDETLSSSDSSFENVNGAREIGVFLHGSDAESDTGEISFLQLSEEALETFSNWVATIKVA
ncbi:uncharacterized protein BDV17DRAFT_277743 [Aspergillus undulatus]|uniref:uncharacterized protein n=1 Tax=Aspergillus undulatus TaxID=1810928 RepID=UPI003CCE08C5